MKTKKIIILLLATGLLFPGCKKDFLKLDNPNLQTTSTFWQTEDQAVLGVNGIYHAWGYDGTLCVSPRHALTAVMILPGHQVPGTLFMQ